ncbi:aromatic ring-opening dioxygenase LigA [candidate division MSBL1 archaeon SCGC-AAA382N08]|uniref:DNA ligase n=1 Tax=candidate division MSBL1 archaeon SCGC-AAA382N08 TaxID=1698285 RepID=A0A133VP83_9EURY|nr:aromatic ring-opening dioxygenase LigA [candidate division MSBL1 archaeon SCGC-AAA382N08]
MVEEPKDNPYIRNPDLNFEETSEIDEKTAADEVEKLREAVEYHNYRYYVLNEPVVSDKVYDDLFDRLVNLENEFDLVDENSPTQRIGGEPLDSFETREHAKEMLSLDSSEDEEEVRRFDERVRKELKEVQYAVEPKFDGFSVEIVYSDGEFDRAVTRGDGVRGDDVSKNVKTIKTVPLRLVKAPDFLSVRGEIYMPKSGFHELNEERVRNGKDPFANPRNAAAGTIRQLDPSIVAERPLDIFFYDILDCSTKVHTQEESFDLLDSLGFKISDLYRIVEDIESFIEYRDEIMGMRDDLEYDLDGVIAKVNSFDKRGMMGKTARHPRWAFAYKFPPKSGRSKVRKIIVQVGRTGKLTPVALLDPVDIKGVTVSRATLHNEERARELGVVEGMGVKVERAGDVIPEIEETLEESESKFTMPDSCPVCGSDVVKEGKYHFCTGGLSCSAQLIRSLQHFCSKSAMNIEGVGEKVARKLVEEGLVSSLADIYELGRDDLVELEKFGEKSADNLLEQIEESKEADFERFLYGLGIRHVGVERAKLLAENFSLEELENADKEELEKVKDLGPEVSASIYSFFRNEKNRETLERLKESIGAFERVEYGDEFEGVKLVFTGGIEGYTRTELKDLMEKNGADVTSSVSGETDYLVVGDDPGQTKLDEARSLGTSIIDTDEFKEKFLYKIT